MRDTRRSVDPRAAHPVGKVKAGSGPLPRRPKLQQEPVITPPAKPEPLRKPRQRRRARDKVKGLLNRMRDRSRRRPSAFGMRMRKRKTALVLSAGVMGFATAAHLPEDRHPTPCGSINAFRRHCSP